MKYRAVLFDLDGTLLDTLQDIADSMNEALKAHGLPGYPAENYKKFVGGGLELLVRRVLPEGADVDTLFPVLIEKMEREYSKRWSSHTALYPGIRDMLDGLSRRGLRLSILSNKPDEFTQAICSHYLNEWKFDIIKGAGKALPRKPDPAAALWIAEQMKIEPAEFVYLGDSSTDMKTAVAAGMRPIGALWGFREADELLESGAELLIARPGELLEVLKAE
jgi:phosphoglycolate phosphatase